MLFGKTPYSTQGEGLEKWTDPSKKVFKRKYVQYPIAGTLKVQ